MVGFDLGFFFLFLHDPSVTGGSKIHLNNEKPYPELRKVSCTVQVIVSYFSYFLLA